MSLSQQTNIGAHIKAVLATTNATISQTSASAASTQDGQTIDRTTLGRRYYSAKAVVSAGYVANATARTAALSLTVDHSSDGSSWESYSTAAAKTFGNSTAGTTDYSTLEHSVSLVGARRYLRVRLHAPTFSDCSSGQGVFSAHGVMVFGGADELPAQ